MLYVDRLSNPIKQTHGHRGKAENKEKYSKAQQYRHRSKAKNDIFTSVDSAFRNGGMTPVCLSMKDENGKLIKLRFSDESSDVETEAVADEDIEEMLFILDSFNIPIKRYHEIAQRYQNLPKVEAITTKKFDLNSECPLNDVEAMIGTKRFSGIV